MEIFGRLEILFILVNEETNLIALYMIICNSYYFFFFNLEFFSWYKENILILTSFVSATRFRKKHFFQ